MLSGCPAGGGLADLLVDPLRYRAAGLRGGHWTAPFFKCDGRLDDWVVTYAAPFFGPSADDPDRLVVR